MARQGLFEWSNVRLGFIKWGLIVFNIAFWCLGCVSLGIGLWLYIERNEYAAFSEGKDLLGSVFLVAVGFGAVIIGFLGIVAAIWESTIIAGVFAVLVTIACGMYLSAGIWAFVHGDDTRQDVTEELETTAEQYLMNSAYKDVWDSLHRQFDCCGVRNASDWLEQRILSLPQVVPDSCCVEERDGCGEPNAQQLPEIYIEGCLDDLVDYEEEQYDIIGPIGIAFGVFQIFGILICILFVVTVSQTKDSYDT